PETRSRYQAWDASEESTSSMVRPSASARPDWVPTTRYRWPSCPRATDSSMPETADTSNVTTERAGTKRPAAPSPPATGPPAAGGGDSGVTTGVTVAPATSANPVRSSLTVRSAALGFTCTTEAPSPEALTAATVSASSVATRV